METLNQEIKEIKNPDDIDKGDKEAKPVAHSALIKTFLIVCIVIAIGLILFLIYQNGKSIYDNGI